MIHFAIIVFTVALSGDLQTAKIPDFSGTWQLDASKTVTSGKLDVRAPVRTRYVEPKYPLQAQWAKVGGTVIIEAAIGADGGVTDARVLESVPMLDKAAIDAVRQWRFRPATVNGQPLPIVVRVEVAFNSSQPTRAVIVGSPRWPSAQTPAMKIVQNSATLVVTVLSPDATTVYRLDGTESYNKVPGLDGTSRDSVSKSHWDGDKLITTISTGAGPQETTETRYLEDGHLIVETVRPNPSGAEPWRTKKEVFNKVGGPGAPL